MSEEPNEGTFGDEPDFEKVEFDFAIESVASIFKGLKKNGVSTNDAAIIVAQLIAKGGVPPEERPENG